MAIATALRGFNDLGHLGPLETDFIYKLSKTEQKVSVRI